MSQKLAEAISHLGIVGELRVTFHLVVYRRRILALCNLSLRAYILCNISNVMKANAESYGTHSSILVTLKLDIQRS